MKKPEKEISKQLIKTTFAQERVLTENSNESRELYNQSRYGNLLEDGRGELAQTERRNIYLDFQRFLVEDSPAIFLYHPVSYTIIRN